MNHTIRIDFRTESGETLAGELVNHYWLVESSTSSVGVAIEIEQIQDDEIDVLVFAGEEMQAHRVNVAHIVAVDEVAV